MSATTRTGGHRSRPDQNPERQVDDDLLDEGMDNQGAAIVIHAGADDYETNPAGDAGPRIACGVIQG